MFNLTFLNYVSANNKNYENVVDFGYSEWVCLNASLIYFNSNNKSELEKLIINSHGDVKKKINFKVINKNSLYSFNFHHYFFKNKNEVVWVEIKNPEVENNMVVASLIVKEGFPISQDLYVGDFAEKFGKIINKNIENLNGNYTLGCDLISLNVQFKDGKIIAAEWKSMID